MQHNTAPVMSLSYGLCEALMGIGNSFYSSLWQQAAAEGIAVFVAAGDSREGRFSRHNVLQSSADG